MSTDSANPEDLLELGLQQVEEFLTDLVEETDPENERNGNESTGFTERYMTYESHTCWCKENSIFEEPLIVPPEMDEFENATRKSECKPADSWASGFYWIPFKYSATCICNLALSMQSWAGAVGRAAEVDEVRARYSPEVFERAYGAWAALGYVNDFRQVAAYYQRLQELEETFTPEAREASRAADARLRSAPPPMSGCLRRLYPHLYPQHEPAPAVSLITESEAAAHPDVRRYVLDHGLTVKTLLAEFRAYAAREDQVATYYHLLCYVNRPRVRRADFPAPPSPTCSASDSTTTTVSSQESESVAVTFVTSKAISSTSQVSQSTPSTSRNISATSSIPKTSEGKFNTNSQTIDAMSLASNLIVCTKPETSRASSQSKFTPPRLQQSIGSTSTNPNITPVTTSNLKALHESIVPAEASIIPFSSPSTVSNPLNLNFTASTSVNQANMMPEWYKEPTASKLRETTNTPTRSRFLASSPLSPSRTRDVTTFSISYYGDTAPIDHRFVNATLFNPLRSSDRSFHARDPTNAAIAHSLYRTAMLGGLPYDMSNLMSPQRYFNTPTSPRSSFNTSGSSYSSLDSAMSPKSSPSSRSKFNTSFSPRGTAINARRSLESSLNRADCQDARRAKERAGPSRPSESFGSPQYYQPFNKKSPNKTSNKGADRGKKKSYTKPWREECTGGRSDSSEPSKGAKSPASGKAGAGAETGRGCGAVGSDASAGASGAPTGSGAAAGDVAAGARGARRRSPARAGAVNFLADRLDKLSLSKDSTSPR